MIVRNRPFGLNTTFMRLCVIRKQEFPKRISCRHASCAPRQSGSWAWRARCPCYPEGWTPSEIWKPWQDRRTLIIRVDQRPAILRMVFVFQAPLLSW